MRHIAWSLCLLVAGCSTAVDEPRAWTHYEAFLWDQAFPNLVLTSHHPDDLHPSDPTLDALRETIPRVTGKATVSLEKRMLPEWAHGGRLWSLEELETLAVNTSTRGLAIDRFGQGDTAHLQIYLLWGAYEGPPMGAFGLMSWGRVFMFTRTSDDLQNASLSDAARPDHERAVIMHEIGHALGLVGCGVPMTAPRKVGLCHSENDASVMAESASFDVGEHILTEGRVKSWRFDADDERDLAEFRGKGALRGVGTR